MYSERITSHRQMCKKRQKQIELQSTLSETLRFSLFRLWWFPFFFLISTYMITSPFECPTVQHGSRLYLLCTAYVLLFIYSHFHNDATPHWDRALNEVQIWHSKTSVNSRFAPKQMHFKLYFINVLFDACMEILRMLERNKKSILRLL